jgi:hypothetical protein
MSRTIGEPAGTTSEAARSPAARGAVFAGHVDDPAYRSFSASVAQARAAHRRFLTQTLAPYGVPEHVIDQAMGSFDDTVVEVVDVVVGCTGTAGLLPA